MNNSYIIAVLCVAAIIFIVIGQQYDRAIQLKLKKELIVIPQTVIDWWSVSHFILYFIFGLLKPGHHGKFFLLGVAFEMFEDMLASDESTQMVNCKNTKDNNTLMSKIYCNGLQNKYWYAKWDDVIVNLLGYTLGSSIQSSRMSLNTI